MSDGGNMPWHLDKRVPLALIIAIITQTAGIVWWAAQSDARIAAVIDGQSFLTSRVGSLEQDQQDRRVDIATMAEQIAGMKDTLDGIRSDQKDLTNLLRHYVTIAKQ